uniref:hypothetical protein n=1 Tax=Roseivirga sp. TaxID=1964215 RepID=UPI004048DB42
MRLLNSNKDCSKKELEYMMTLGSLQGKENQNKEVAIVNTTLQDKKALAELVVGGLANCG